RYLPPNDTAVGLTDDHARPDGPEPLPRQRLGWPLAKHETGPPIGGHARGLLDHRHARSQDVLLAPAIERSSTLGTDGGQQVAPRRVPVRVRGEEAAQPALESIGPDKVVQLLEHRRGLVVHDGAVVTLGLI